MKNVSNYFLKKWLTRNFELWFFFQLVTFFSWHRVEQSGGCVRCSYVHFPTAVETEQLVLFQVTFPKLELQLLQIVSEGRGEVQENDPKA